MIRNFISVWRCQSINLYRTWHTLTESTVLIHYLVIVTISMKENCSPMPGRWRQCPRFRNHNARRTKLVEILYYSILVCHWIICSLNPQQWVGYRRPSTEKLQSLHTTKNILRCLSNTYFCTTGDTKTAHGPLLKSARARERLHTVGYARVRTENSGSAPSVTLDDVATFTTRQKGRTSFFALCSRLLKHGTPQIAGDTL